MPTHGCIARYAASKTAPAMIKHWERLMWHTRSVEYVSLGECNAAQRIPYTRCARTHPISLPEAAGYVNACTKARVRSFAM